MNISVKAIKNGVKKSTTVNIDLSEFNSEGGAFVCTARNAVYKLGFAKKSDFLQISWREETFAFEIVKIAQGGHRELIGTVKAIVSMRKIKSVFGE